MSIFLTGANRVIVQGMTGAEGMKHTQRMLASGTAVVGGVNPRKAGQSVEIDGVTLPVFGSVADAMAATGADTSVVFVPPALAPHAYLNRPLPIGEGQTISQPFIVALMTDLLELSGGERVLDN